MCFVYNGVHHQLFKRRTYEHNVRVSCAHRGPGKKFLSVVRIVSVNYRGSFCHTDKAFNT